MIACPIAKSFGNMTNMLGPMLALALAITPMAALSAEGGTMPGKTAGTAATQPVPANGSLHIVAYHQIANVVSAEGVVEAVRQSTIAAQVAGQIVELKVKAGDTVKAGQVLLRIDQRAAEQALSGSQSQVAEAQASLSLAQRNLARNKELFGQKFIGKAALDQSETEYKAAQARLAALQASAGQASTAKTLTVISAPYAGVIATSAVEVGDMATPGRTLLTMFDPAAMRVAATLSESSLRQVSLQNPARIAIAGNKSAKDMLTSTQITLLPLADSQTHSRRLRLELGNAPGLMPGQFARVHFVTGSERKLAIPEQALLKRSEVNAVYVRMQNGMMQMRQIRLGESSADGWIEVLAGLREGEQIALDPIKAGLAANPPANEALIGEQKK